MKSQHLHFVFAILLNEGVFPQCSPKRLRGAPHEYFHLSEPACSHRTSLPSPSLLTPALGAVCPGAHLSMPPHHCPFRWEITWHTVFCLFPSNVRERGSSRAHSEPSDCALLVFLQAPSFYWEIEIVSYGDSDDDTGPIVSFGFATEAEKRDGAWTNPVGTCLFHK